MWDIAGSSQDDAVSRCSRACCSRRAWVVPLVFRKAEPDDSISPPTSDSIRFAKSVDRQLHCKSHGGGMVDQARERGRGGYRHDGSGDETDHFRVSKSVFTTEISSVAR